METMTEIVLYRVLIFGLFGWFIFREIYARKQLETMYRKGFALGARKAVSTMEKEIQEVMDVFTDELKNAIKDKQKEREGSELH